MVEERTYFERPLTIAPILGSFFVVFLPLFFLQLVPNFIAWAPQVLLLEGVGLGTSHFFITLAVYLRGENLDYFRSSLRNMAVYLLAPLLIFAFFASSEAGHWRQHFPLVAPYVLAGVRFADFFHVGRQSVGMMQIWKRGKGLPAVTRSGEQLLFVGLACLQWETYLLGGRFRADSMYATLPAIALCALFLLLAYEHARAAAAGSRRGRFVPLAYLCLQAACAASAVYDTRLYLTALVMHYVEYHVIMWPRLFRAPASSSSSTAPALRGGASTHAVDRVFALLRPRAWLFYALLGTLVIAFELRSYVTVSTPTTAFFVHIFDGVFAVHYFVEAFLWKFRNPYYQKTLAPLYFEPAPQSLSVKQRAARALRGTALAALSIAGVFLCVQLASIDLQRRAFDPMLAESHLRWGVELARRGELAAARSHFAEALRRVPDDSQAKQLLQWVDAHLER